MLPLSHSCWPVLRSIASLGFRAQAMDQAVEEQSLKEDILALAPFMRAHADRFSKEDLAQYSAQLEQFGGDPLDALAA
jgi:hypothetical protein